MSGSLLATSCGFKSCWEVTVQIRHTKSCFGTQCFFWNCKCTYYSFPSERWLQCTLVWKKNNGLTLPMFSYFVFSAKLCMKQQMPSTGEIVNEISPWERERDEKSNEEKLNWAASGSGKPRLRKCNKAAQCFHRKSILCFSLMSSYCFVEDRSDFSTCGEQWRKERWSLCQY